MRGTWLQASILGVGRSGFPTDLTPGLAMGAREGLRPGDVHFGTPLAGGRRGRIVFISDSPCMGHPSRSSTSPLAVSKSLWEASAPLFLLLEPC